MSNHDYRALCTELVAALDPKVIGIDGYGPVAALLPSARAALAQPEPARQPTFSELLMPPPRTALAQPEPVAPTDEELLELMPQQFRDDLATVSRLAAHGTSPDVTPGIFRVSLNTGALDYARAVLAKWGCQ
jgi:hypothetical protein